MIKISTIKRTLRQSNMHADNFMGGFIMPMYMEIHKNVDGLTAEAVIQAHKQDLETQGLCGVNFLK